MNCTTSGILLSNAETLAGKSTKVWRDTEGFDGSAGGAADSADRFPPTSAGPTIGFLLKVARIFCALPARASVPGPAAQVAVNVEFATRSYAGAKALMVRRKSSADRLAFVVVVSILQSDSQFEQSPCDCGFHLERDSFPVSSIHTVSFRARLERIGK